MMRDDAKACEAEGHWYEVEYPEDMELMGFARRWVFRCQHCGAISDREVPPSMRKRGV